MSEYGVKIKNYQAGSIYEVELGVRSIYDCKGAMFSNSLFCDFLMENGLQIRNGATRDIVCIDFSYGSRDYESEMKHFDKLLAEAKVPQEKILYLRDEAERNKDKYVRKTAKELRHLFYTQGVQIRYPKWENNKIVGEEAVTYRMLYRTSGKAKKGSCMFICDRLYAKAHEFLWMGLHLSEQNAKIVEIGAYSSLITSSIEDRIHIDPSQILIVRDVDSFCEAPVVSIETNSAKECMAVHYDKYKLKNTLFDGQALIDTSIFPEWANGYILLRHHFCKMAAFHTNIQKFFQDYYGDAYESSYISDMWGNLHKATDIKLITTENAIKWKSFEGASYEYWSEWVRKNGSMFGIVKTAHQSKLGDKQRMSYQMVNALSEEIMDDVLADSMEYIRTLKNDNSAFLEYLRQNSNYANDFDVLIALCEHNPDFVKCDYFVERKGKIISNYVVAMKTGRVLQNADNLVIVGSPYAMLLRSVGEDPLQDPTFSIEDGSIQCYTSRFSSGEYLAEFRSPFNSCNNLGHLHNSYHKYFDKYFNFGDQIIAINMVGTCFQDRNNGSDQDSDSIYVTNQPQIVAHAKYCMERYHTIVNNIPKETNHYTNTLDTFAMVDCNISASQTDIGESSNLAQICLTYTYNFDDPKYEDFACILAVLAQAAIDSAKRRQDVDISSEIKRIKKEMNVEAFGYPKFWLGIRKNFNKSRINEALTCPMNHLYDSPTPRVNKSPRKIPFEKFFIEHKPKQSLQSSRKVEDLITKYSLKIKYQNTTQDEDNENYLLLRNDFDELLEDIRRIKLPNKYVSLMSWLIRRAFMYKERMNSKTHNNRAILIKILYELNPDCFLQCFRKSIDE